jgi:D-alanyl-D-alanine carboxypeptidase
MFKRSVCSRFAANVALSGILVALVGAGLSTPAEARHHHRHAHHAQAVRHHGHSGVHARVAARHNRSGAVAPIGATAAIVVDGASGRMIYGLNENAPRHPASVTKVMTLYLLFEQLEKGRFSLNDEIEVSAHAAAQAPSKLGLRPGQSIRIEDAIKAICTKSANDIAVAVAEAIGGTESEFAEQMTRKAYSLGMNHTFYRNASGLPNPEQITTAADLAVLGRSIQERFPRYYRYFSMHEFAYHGQRIHNHNHLMDRVEGMDGIKTGYTAASGFNLLSSVKRDGHYIVSVVMGGKSARSRDNYMEALIEKYIDEGGSARGATRVAEQEEPAREEPVRQARIEPKNAPEPERKPVVLTPASVSASSDAPARLPIAAVSPDPRPRPAYVSAAQPARESEETRLPTATIAHHASATDGSTSAQAHESAGAVTPAGRWIAGPVGRDALRAAVRFQPSGKAEAKSETKSEAKLDNRIEVKPPVRPELKQEARLETRAVVKSDESASSGSKQALPTKPPVPGWMIQIGATDDADKAAALLSKAKAQRGALLASAKPYTEKVSKGGGTIYRARFAGLEESSAEAACKALKTSGFNCFTTRN